MHSVQSEVSQAVGRRYDCPQCGAPVPFRSSIAISAVCEHCRSVVVRRDFQLETYGTMAELPPDLSPLQLGTKGYCMGRSFTLVGRLRLHWGAGSWTEWCADFGNGTYGWVAEVMGHYMVSFATTAPEISRLHEAPAAGSNVKINGQAWLVSDVKEARCLAAEGELPFPVALNAVRVSADLTGPKGEFGTIEFGTGENQLFTGEYAQFEELNFSELRKVPGWDQDAEITRHRSEAVNCPQCGAVMNLRAEGLSMSAVCGSCGTIVDSSAPRVKEIGRVAATTLRINPILPIGRRGLLKNIPWEIIGFMRRQDRWCSWSEYLLFNPWLGFRFLVSYNGHWSLVRLLPGHPNSAQYQGKRYQIFSREEAQTTDVLGEFYWRVRVGERAAVADYICPPYILSSETSSELNEITWSHGEYVPAEEVAAAYEVKLNAPSGIYLNQPNPHTQKWHQLRGTFAAAVLVFILIQILCLGFASKTAVMSEQLAYDPQAADKTIVSSSFKVSANSAPLDVTAYTALPSTGFLALKGDLINTTTKATTPISLPLTGYDSLASMEQTVTLPGVPSGTYYFRFTPDASMALGPASIQISAKSGGIFWSNFLFGLVAICAWPLWLSMRVSSFEKARWMESEFSA